jgi:2-hydroxy-6-oxonona-2,4-dienedioate hydrolase
MLSAEHEIEHIASLGQSARTEFNGCELSWRIWGAGAPLLLLHGGYGAWTHWLRNIEALSQHYRVLVPDVPGHGASAMPPLGWTAEWLASALSAGAEQLSEASDKLRGAGFSMGGLLLGHVAAQLSDRFSHVVLLGPNGMQLSAPDLPPLQSLRSLGVNPSAEAVCAVHRFNLAALMLAQPQAVDATAIELQTNNIAQSRLNTEALPRSDVLLRALPRVRARISGIWGEHDVFVGAYMDERRQCLAQFQADLDFRVISGAGHWVMYEQPERVNAALLEQLAA